MLKQIIKLASVAMILYAFATPVQAQEAKELISKVVEANGGADALHKLRDVSFEYTFKVEANGSADVSREKYIFDGEVSYAQYTQRQVFALPEMEGVHTQFFDGSKTMSMLNGALIKEQQPAYIGHALRKTNFYWFAMMFKLTDPGVKHQLMDDRVVNGITYKIVEMTFDEEIGESSDRFVLYINPSTYRIDQFLFTAKGFGMTEPSLMKVEYEKIKGIYLTTHRKFAPANWEGKVTDDNWTEQITQDIKFKNGFDLENIQNSL